MNKFKRRVTFYTLLRDYLSLTKPRINLLVLFTTFVGVWMATAGDLNYPALLKTLIGTGLTVAGAAVFNCYQEADVDASMKRTQDRPIPSGRVSGTNAFRFGVLCALSGLGLLYFEVNFLSFLFAFVALVVYTPIYTYLKGLTSLSTLVGAIPGALPPVIGWVAVTGQVELPAIILFLIMFFWQPPHFLALALYRKNEYQDAGLVMLPIEMNDQAAVRQILVYSVALLLMSLLPVQIGMAGMIYFVLAFITGLIFLVYGSMGILDSYRNNDTWSRRLFFLSILYLMILFTGFFLS